MTPGRKQRRPQGRWILAWCCALFALGGGDCPWRNRMGSPLTPALPQTATLDEVIGKINQNGSNIVSLSTNNASIGGRAGGWPFPALSAKIAVSRPRQLRLIGETGVFGGKEVDLGSNDELFWFWVRRNQPPAIYYSRHDEFAGSQAARAFPIEPQWIIDSLGLTTIDPQGEHYGPQAVGKGRLEIRTIVPSPLGTLQKVTRIDANYGWIVEQHLYDPAGKLVASALAKDHQADPVTGLVVPRQLELQWPSTQLTLKIHLGDVILNQIVGDPAALWTMPEIPGYDAVNLANVQPRFAQTPEPTRFVPRSAANEPSTDRDGWAFRPRFLGAGRK